MPPAAGGPYGAGAPAIMRRDGEGERGMGRALSSGDGAAVSPLLQQGRGRGLQDNIGAGWEGSEERVTGQHSCRRGQGNGERVGLGFRW